MPAVESMRRRPDDDGDGGRFTAGPGVAAGAVYTGAMVDEAAERVLEDYDADTRAMILRMWSNDPSTEFANAFFRSQARSKKNSLFGRVGRVRHTVKQVLREEEVRALVDAYPDFDLTFDNVEGHDHAVAAAARALDARVLRRNIPEGVRYKDIGGNILSAVERGDTDVVVVAPSVDAKDPMRHVKARMRLQRISAGAGLEGMDSLRQDRIKSMAGAVLDPATSSKHVVEKRAQEDKTLALASVSCHVYDIPIGDWPLIMQNGGTRVHEGCLHFSDKLFEQSVGSMGIMGQRYEIDAAKDVIRMGFEGSAAPWYEHRWSDYMKYGVDQILHGKKVRYSYKVTGRRGDTLFFRILEVANTAEENPRQYYRTPGVPMVEVQGFDLRPTVKSQPLSRKTFMYPQYLWDRMLREASLQVLKFGKPDINELSNVYRVASVAHTFNSVMNPVSAVIDTFEVPMMVAHAGASAYASVLLMNAETRAMMQQQIDARERASESTIYKGAAAFFSGILTVLQIPLLPISWLMAAIDDRAREKLQAFLVTWKPVAQLKRHRAALFVPKGSPLLLESYSGDDGLDMPLEGLGLRAEHINQMFAASGDPEVAAMILNLVGDLLPTELRDHLRSAVDKSKPSGAGRAGGVPKPKAPSAETTEPPDYSSRGGIPTDDECEERLQRMIGKLDPKKIKVTRHKVKNRAEKRRNAILEAIESTEAETQKVASSCRRLLTQLVPDGRNADKNELMRGREKRANPDIWEVVNGVLVKSMCGGKSDKFCYAAAWMVRGKQTANSNLVPVAREYYDGQDSVSGMIVQRTHYLLPDRTYCGLVLVTDDMLIFNGPSINTALKAALDLDHDSYDIIVNQGGAGAGKTTTIVEQFEEGDSVLCPVRESTDDTRKRLKGKLHDIRERRKMVRTLDSYLANYERVRQTGGLRSRVVHGDEGYMARAGPWYAVAALVGARQVFIHGDIKQIPATPRVESPVLYLRIDPDVTIERYEVFRCAPKIMAIWAPAYNYTLRVAKPVDEGWVTRAYAVEQIDWCFTGDVVLLCMNQHTKPVLKTMFAERFKQAGAKFQVFGPMSTHESEGKTFDHVILYNDEVRVRDAGEVSYLYNQEPYVLVAASRPRTSFTYLKASRAPDLLSTWMKAATDPRRIAAVTDMATIGLPKVA